MSKKILIVDDEPDVVTVTKFTLEHNGFEVVTAYDGEDGIKKAKEHKPDLILLDMLMPKMFGSDVAIELKADPELRDIPIVFITNVPLDFLTVPKEGELPRDAQGNICLPKSCSEKDLVAIINSLTQVK